MFLSFVLKIVTGGRTVSGNNVDSIVLVLQESKIEKKS